MEKAYWYERGLYRRCPLFTPKAGWGEIEKDRRWIMRRMRRHAYKRDLEEFRIRKRVKLSKVSTPTQNIADKLNFTHVLRTAACRALGAGQTEAQRRGEKSRWPQPGAVLATRPPDSKRRSMTTVTVEEAQARFRN